MDEVEHEGVKHQVHVISVFSVHVCESTKIEISNEARQRGTLFTLFLSLHQAAGAFHVPIQSFTIYINGIKEPSETVVSISVVPN